jgi:hypothetical protein
VQAERRTKQTTQFFVFYPEAQPNFAAKAKTPPSGMIAITAVSITNNGAGVFFRFMNRKIPHTRESMRDIS